MIFIIDFNRGDPLQESFEKNIALLKMVCSCKKAHYSIIDYIESIFREVFKI